MQQLAVSNIDKLHDVEYKGLNARVTCPIHKNGHERTPSCDVLLEDKEDLPAGTVACFGCGYKANFVKFISDCLGISRLKATEWLLNIATYDFVSEKRESCCDIFEEKCENNYNELPIVTVEQLKGYEYIHPYMFKRKLTDEIIDKFDIGYSPQEECLTFPVYVDGECLFVAKRKVNYKRFDMPQINPKPIYGLDYITDNEVIVCESVINALTCWSYGKQAIALFGTGSKYQCDLLNRSSIRKFILALDGDEAGENGTQRLIKGLTNKIVTVLNIPKGKDINDLTKEEFDNLEESF